MSCQPLRIFISAMLICAGLSSCALAGNEPLLAAQTVSPGKPIRFCRQFEPSTLSAIKAGNQHLVIAVKSYRPPQKDSAGFIVTLLPEKNAKPIELLRFGIHPDTEFSSSGKEPRQRFLLPLKDHAASMQGEQICVAVGFYSSGTALSGGEAVIGLELADRPRD